MKKFPKILYVKIEKRQDPEDDFLLADEHFPNLAEPEDNVQVAVYTLDTVRTAVNKTELVD